MLRGLIIRLQRAKGLASKVKIGGRLRKDRFLNLKEYITIDPNKRFGRPILIGTGISVSDILNCLGIGMTKESILNDLPALTEPMINAASRQDHPGFAL